MHVRVIHGISNCDLHRYSNIDILSVYVEKFKTPTVIFSLVLSMLEPGMNF